MSKIIICDRNKDLIDAIKKANITSNYDVDVVYEVGKIVKPKEKFDENRWNECSSGIHFFITKEEAEQWQG